MKFLQFFFATFVGHFALLDPDPDPDAEYGSGSNGLIESGSNPDPDLIAVTIRRLLIYTQKQRTRYF